MRKRMKLFNLIVIAFMIVAGGLVTLNQLERDITVLQDVAREIRLREIKVTSVNGELNKEIGKKDDEAYIIELARTQYGYLMPGEIRFKVVNPEALGTVPEARIVEENP